MRGKENLENSLSRYLRLLNPHMYIIAKTLHEVLIQIKYFDITNLENKIMAKTGSVSIQQLHMIQI